MNPEHLITGALLLAIVTILAFLPWMCNRSFKAGENVSTEGTVYTKRIEYRVELLRAPVYTHVISALREWDDELSLLEARRRTKLGTLAYGIDVRSITALINALHKNAPSATIKISSTSFEKTFTMQQWKEFHDGK